MAPFSWFLGYGSPLTVSTVFRSSSRELAPQQARFFRKRTAWAAGVAGGSGPGPGGSDLGPRLLRPRCLTPRRSGVGRLVGRRQRREASGYGGLGAGKEPRSRFDSGYARANLPRSVLRKRDCSFLSLISRVSAACSVACGVLPAGLVQ